ncbi:hypothetical protein [Mesorhizobium shangrilense]|uniref:Uncharacterized protein n=1 Tax=Mesorhizobium shangrilense TaxID=460060 RepID=A0ABV2DGI6_9HYPH
MPRSAMRSSSLWASKPHNYLGLPTPEGCDARAIILRTAAKGLM